MVISNSRRLRQVSNAEDLALPGELTDMVGDLQARLAADADVDFVKIMVFPVVRSDPAVFKAKAIRDTSPPEAIFAKGCIASPVLAEK